MSAANKCVWEILVPTVRNNGKPFKLRYHKLWDAKVLDITGGLTILPPVKGHWVSSGKELFVERMIPVRIACTQEQIEAIAELTARYYDQKAVLFYLVSDKVFIREYK